MTAAAMHRWAATFALVFTVVACGRAGSDTLTVGDGTTVTDNVRMPANPDAFDREMVRQLTAAGANVTKPTRVLYSLYIPSRRDADSAARKLRAAGYGATVQPPAGKLPDGTTEKRWWLVATNQAAPSLDHARRVRPFMDALARQYHGEYAGWGAKIVK